LEDAPDFDAAHARWLPERIASAHRLPGGHRLGDSWGALAESQTQGLPALALRLPDGRAWRYAPQGGTIALDRGDDAPLVVELGESDWLGLSRSTETLMGLVMGQRAQVLSGEVADFIEWETALRVLYEALPPWDPEAPLIDSDGRELDPSTAFAPEDDPEQMAEFLRAAGYIVVRGLLPSEEVAGLVEAAEIARERAVDGDQDSWWSTHDDGRRGLVRVLSAGRDPRMRALPSDPRLMRIVGLSDFELEATETEGVSVIFKHSGMRFDGKADQPWHRDCGLGGHRLMCPLMNGSLFLTPADRASGELRFLPGSWQTVGARIHDPDYRMGVAIEAQPGDFALHYGDGLHAGTPPTAKEGPFRWSAVFEYGPVGRSAEQSQEHYDQLMHEADARSLRSS